ncbi:DNA-processing protein DprA [Patescibacteria group bacterium]|nr:DNA-processing protein DprA [Patescibacteria group bacterium]
MSSLEKNTSENLYLAALSSITGLGPKRLQKLKQVLKTWQNIWESNTNIWQQLKIPPKTQQLWQKKRETFNFSLLETSLENNQITLIDQQHPNYPIALMDLESPPLLLYAQGTWPKSKKQITIIGSRQPSPYGEEALKMIAIPLIKAGYSTVSGLALGLDSLAHRLSLKYGGHTTAIIGSGLNNIYPRENKNLAQDIIKQGGLILSEYYLNAPPIKANFILRNRLLAAISPSTLLVEANLKSGSMITARHTQKLKRKLYAVPGNIFNQQAAGCHQLIQNGAILCNQASEILGVNSMETNIQAENYLNLEPVALSIIKLLKKQRSSFSELSADQISALLKLDTVSTNSTLSILEMKKYITQRQGRYSINSKTTEY